MATKVTLDRDTNADGSPSSFVVIRARGLPWERFKAFREAIEGARFIRERRANLSLMDKVPGILRKLREAGFPVDVEPSLVRALQEHTAQQWLDLKSAQERATKIDEEYRKIGKALYPFQRTGASWLSTRTGALLSDQMGLGKSLAKDELVMTPQGWREIGRLSVADEVIGSNGVPTRVLGVYPQGKLPLFRVTMTDGASVRVTADHLWYVETANSRFTKTKGKVMTTALLLEAGLKSIPSGLNRAKTPVPRKAGNTKWFIPMVKPVKLARRKLPVEPYLLGALLANGRLGVSTSHSGTREQRVELRRVLPRSIVLSHPPGNAECDWRFNSLRITNVRNLELTRSVKSLGLRGSRSFTKFVPKDYLLGSVAQRIALLQGLCDNDGCVSKDGVHVEYNTVSPQLCADVLELVRSLGGSARVSTRIPVYEYKGEKLKGQLDHRIRISLPEGIVPFRVPSKKSRFKTRTKYPPIHGIESITREGSGEAVCIRVAAKDHLFVTRDYILTHNTVQAITALPAAVPSIVIAPAVAKGVWLRELTRWRPQLRVSVLKGRESFRWPEPGEVLVTNYDILPEIHAKSCPGTLPAEKCVGCLTEVNRLGIRVKVPGHRASCDVKGNLLEARPCPGCAKLLKLSNPGTVAIVDEAHALKSGKARRTLRFRALSSAIRENDGRVWLLTATPLVNNPSELWNVYAAAGIAEEAFGTWQNFVKIFEGKALFYGGYEWGTPEGEVAERIRRVSLRRMRADVLPDLPSKTYRELVVDIDRKALAECDKYLEEVGGLDQLITLIEKDGIKFETMSRVRSALATAKTPALMQLLPEFEDAGEPVVVFSAHRFPIDLLKKRIGWRVITGDTKPEERTEIEDQFQRGELKGVGCTIKAGGVSITLTRSNQSIFVDREFTPALNNQAEDRIVRIGQTRGSIITILVADHQLDIRLAELIEGKQKLITASVDAARVVETPLAALDAEQEDIIKAAQEEVRQGRVARRFPESTEETWAYENLFTLPATLNDRPLVTKLAEEAQTIGLSEAQWALAIRVCKRYPECGDAP